jgi:hypothetical protein
LTLARLSAAEGDWVPARSTYFGTDAWTINIGSCQYGYLSKDVGTGWDVAGEPTAWPAVRQRADGGDRFPMWCPRARRAERHEPSVFPGLTRSQPLVPARPPAAMTDKDSDYSGSHSGAQCG